MDCERRGCERFTRRRVLVGLPEGERLEARKPLGMDGGETDSTGDISGLNGEKDDAMALSPRNAPRCTVAADLAALSMTKLL